MNNDEFLEYKEYADQLTNMNDYEKKGELNDFISTINDMKKRILLERKSIIILRFCFLRHIIPHKYLSNIKECSSSICYEFFYLDVIKKYIKKMIKKNDYSDTLFVYQCLVGINVIGNYRDYYISNLLNYDSNNDIINNRLIFDYNSISNDVNKMLKKIK